MTPHYTPDTATRLIAQYTAQGKPGEAYSVYQASTLTWDQYHDAKAAGRKSGTTTMPAPTDRNTTAVLQDNTDQGED